MTLTMYGIRGCDTVKRARAWLDARHIDYMFHDYKSQGVDAKLLATWTTAVGWEKVLNRSGTTFRKLPEADTANLDARRAIALMVANPSAIRRPVVTGGDRLLVGFDPVSYEAVLSGK